ncbi:MAG: alpha/beta fold hydrolase [Ilumatobacter sp.]|nr:alpha/beta fold hydrolase [Ilumatobacter sp.]
MIARSIGIIVCVLATLAACSSAETATDPSVETSARAPVTVEERTLDTDDGTIHMRVVGPVDASDTLIAIHGGPGLSLEAMTAFEMLAGADRRVVSYDQRGTGRSTVPTDLDYRLDAHVDDLESIRSALGAEHVQLVGQSWGGAVAAAYAATHPEWMSLYVQASVRLLEGGDARAESMAQMEAVGRTVSRMTHDHSMGMMAMLLSQTEHFDDALATSLHCLESQTIGQAARMNALVPAVRSLAALGRFEAALDLIEKDFGPMSDAQRERFKSIQLISLVLILHQLGQLEPLGELIGTAYASSSDFLEAVPEILPFLTDIVGSERALSSLATSIPVSMTADRIAVLIEHHIAEIRNHIASEPNVNDASSSQV